MEKQEIPQEAQGYFDPAMAIPSDVVTLPTGGELYQNNQKTVTVEVLVGADEELININSIKNNAPNFYIELLNRKVKDLGFPPEELLMIDVHKILFHILMNSYGPLIEYNMNDPYKKGAEIPVSLDIRKDFEEKFPDHVQWDENMTTLIELPKTKHKVKVGLPTLGVLARAKSLHDNQYQGAVKKSAMSFILAMCIKEIHMNGEVIKDKGTIDTALSRLPLGDYDFLKREFDNIEPKIICGKYITSNAQGEDGQPLKFFREWVFDPIFFFAY